MSIRKLLEKREHQGASRSLKLTDQDWVDFSSNDYLGLARSVQLKESILRAYQDIHSKNGSTGSRLLTGNSESIVELEFFLAQHFQFDTSTLFSSGYMANLAFFSTLPQKGDTVIYDELSHACIKDGIRLSFAKKLPFKHSDLVDLEKKLSGAEGNVYVACESVYSMDGDLAPLKELAHICEKHKAKLVVDEAHSTGIWGAEGQGLVYELDLTNKVFATIHTFGKGMGVHGASVSGSQMVKEALINFARPFIYTTAPSDFEVLSIKLAFEQLMKQPNRQANLFHKINLFNEHMEAHATPSPIKSIIIGGNAKTSDASKYLVDRGLDVRPILSPTVQEGKERLRVCLHTYNTEEEIDLLTEHLRALVK